MTPTQRDSYESLWNALHEIDSAAVFLPTFEVTHDGGIEAVTKNIVDAIKQAVVALERFGAGGGESVNQWRKAGTSEWWDGFPDHSDGGGPYETRTLYTHPSPSDLRAAYLRGLEDAAKVADAKALTWRVKPVPLLGYSAELEECAEKIRALKGKQ